MFPPLALLLLATAAQPAAAPAAIWISRSAELALACVRKEYPNKIAHVLNGDADVKAPRELTPAFYGCYDWHSSVHGHWLLANAARQSDQRRPGTRACGIPGRRGIETPLPEHQGARRNHSLIHKSLFQNPGEVLAVAPFAWQLTAVVPEGFKQLRSADPALLQRLRPDSMEGIPVRGFAKGWNVVFGGIAA